MQREKNIKEFLELLIQLTQANIDFFSGKKCENIDLSKYSNEFERIQILINSFDFCSDPPINNALLTHPMPKEIKEIFNGTK